MLENYLRDLQKAFNGHSQSEIPSLKIEMNVDEVAGNLFEKHKEDIEKSGGRNVVMVIDAEIRNKLATGVLRAKASNLKNGTIGITVEEGELNVKLI